MRHKKIWMAAAAIAAGGALWFGYAALTGPADQTTSRASHEIILGTIEEVVTAQGKLEPKDSVAVGAQVSGQVETLLVDFSDTVEAGELIAQIDPQVYQSRVAGGEARLKNLQAQRAQQEAQVKQAEQKQQRNDKLFKTKAVSEEVYQDAQTALAIARAQLDALDAQIEEAQSTLEGDKTNLGYTAIYAPMSGTVVNVVTKEGETLNANQTTPTIVEIANLDTMTVRAQVAEADIMRIEPDMPVYFTTLGSQGRRWQAAIRQILPSPEEINDVVLYNVLADVDNDDGRLMSGMTTQMFFVTGRAEDAPVIPVSALSERVPQEDGDGTSAYRVEVAGKGGRVESRVIQVGLSDRTVSQVVSGLSAGERILMPAPMADNGAAAARRPRMPRL